MISSGFKAFLNLLLKGLLSGISSIILGKRPAFTIKLYNLYEVYIPGLDLWPVVVVQF